MKNLDSNKAAFQNILKNAPQMPDNPAPTKIKDYIYQKVPHSIFLEDKYDDAVIGFCIKSKKPIYSLKKCAEIQMQINNCDFEKAYIDFLLIMSAREKVTIFTFPIFCLDFKIEE